jgi:hypothetical protein
MSVTFVDADRRSRRASLFDDETWSALAPRHVQVARLSALSALPVTLGYPRRCGSTRAS